MYKIGIIDDVQSERADIQVSILDNVDNPENILFKEYQLERKSQNELLSEIQEDVSNEEIHALIVDFRLDTKEDVIEGWEIVEFAHKEFPEFPVVIMTNVPEESKQSKYIDADKVYPKKIFLNPSLDETNKLVGNITLNMARYDKRRKELEAMLAVELEKLEGNRESIEILESVINIENELMKYKQIYQTTLDTSLEMDELKEAFALLDKYESLVNK